MAYGLRRSAASNGIRSNSTKAACMSAEPSAERRAFIRFGAMRSAPCADYGVRTLQKPTYSLASVADRFTRSLQHYLGHKNIQHTVRYTELSPDRFKDFWR